jgi:hypothetical protein
MPLTLLQIVNAAQAELGLPQSATVVGNSDATTQQMLALANRALDELRRRNRWTAMQFEYNLVVNVPVVTTGNISTATPNVITNLGSTTGVVANYFTVSGNAIPQAARVQSVDSTTQVTMDMEAGITTNLTGGIITFAQDTYPMPAGFDWFNNRTMWDRTNRWELLGPDSPQMDQWHRSGIVATGPRRHFRKIGPYADTFRIWPPPLEITSPLQLVFEYLSIAAVAVHGSASTFAQYFANDDDTPLLDDQAIILGLEWMFWQRKGFGYAEMKNDWIDYVDRLKARDGAAATLQLVKRQNPIFISPNSVQDGFFPGPVGPNIA